MSQSKKTPDSHSPDRFPRSHVAIAVSETITKQSNRPLLEGLGFAVQRFRAAFAVPSGNFQVIGRALAVPDTFPKPCDPPNLAVLGGVVREWCRAALVEDRGRDRRDGHAVVGRGSRSGGHDDDDRGEDRRRARCCCCCYLAVRAGCAARGAGWECDVEPL